MKIPALLAAALFSLLTGCVVTPVITDPGYPSGPGYPPGPGPLPGYINTPGEASRLGEGLGRDDRRDGRSHYAGRYRGRVPSHLWTAFSAGYERGFHSGGPWSGGGPGDHGDYNHSVYQSGHRAGQLDRLRHLSNNYRRHFGEYPIRFENSFRRGYQAGWR
jgi:hypothetical protein